MMKSAQPLVVQQSAIRRYSSEAPAVADVATLKKVRIPACVNGTAATGYSLVVRAADSIRAQEILKA